MKGKLICFGMIVLGLSGCGTRTGNPSVYSAAFSPTGGSLGFRGFLYGAVSEFKFCIRRVKLEAPDDSTVGGDANGEIIFQPGLIDVSSGAAAKWGEPAIPTNLQIKRMKIKLGVDQSLCGVNYSIRFNGVSSNEEIQFRWKFDPPLNSNVDAIELRLQAFVNALLADADAGTLTSGRLKTLIEGAEETGKVK